MLFYIPFPVCLCSNLQKVGFHRIHAFFSSLLSHNCLFPQWPVLSDNSRDGPVKASPIIVFEQHCSLVLCSSETRLLSICCLYHINAGHPCQYRADRKFITFMCTHHTLLCQGHCKSFLSATSQDILVLDSIKPSFGVHQFEKVES